MARGVQRARLMRAITRWILGSFASPIGVFVLAFLDSTLFFSLPFGIDAAVILLAARSRSLAWLVPLVAVVGSCAGAALTFWMGQKAGEQGLDRYLNKRRVDHVRRRVGETGAVALALFDLIPPPFPFTAVVLAAGALDVSPRLFFATLGVARLFRFGLEAYLATRFGRQILQWIESDMVQDVVFAFIVLGAGLTILTLWRYYASARRPRAAVS
jgi:membrane protein YqaA with SNARE-associated domain